MTYSTDIADDDHHIGFYAAFDGIKWRIGEEDYSAAPWSISGTFWDNLLNVSLSGSSLDRIKGVASPASVTLEIADDSNARSIFSRRGEEATLQSGITSSTDPIVVNEIISGNWAVNTLLYVDKETMLIDNTPTGTTNGSYPVTRGTWSSTATAHRANAVVSDKPRHWKDRGVSLYAVTANGNSKKIFSGYVTSTPSFSEGVWTLSATSLMSSLSKDLNTGFDSASINKIADSSSGYTNLDFEMEDASGFCRPGGYNPQVIVEWEHNRTGTTMRTVHSLLGVDTVSSPNSITIGQSILQFIDGEGGATEGGRVRVNRLSPTSKVKTIRQRLSYNGTMKETVLRLLLSDTGDTSNGSYDTLPGRGLDANSGAEKRIPRSGIAIDSSDVDTASFDEMDDAFDQPGTLYLDEPTPFIDVWANEFAWRAGGYLGMNGSGQIAFFKYRSAMPDQTKTTLDQDEFSGLEIVLTHDEDDIISRVTFESNYSQRSKSFNHSTSLAILGPDRIYDDDRGIHTYKSAMCWVGNNADYAPHGVIRVSEGDVAMQMDRMVHRIGDGLVKVSFRLPWRYSELAIGDILTLSDDRVPYVDGNVGFSSKDFEIISLTPDLDSLEIEIIAEGLTPGFFVAPAVFVSSYDAGTKTVTIDTTGVEGDLFATASPGQLFGANFEVHHYYTVTNNLDTVAGLGGTYTVASVTATTITFDAVTVTPSAGDLLILGGTSSPTSDTAPVTSATNDEHIFQTEDGGWLGTSYLTAYDGSKWS